MSNLPHWAQRLNYYHHSNPKDLAKTYFEKSFVRPLRKKCKANLDAQIEIEHSEYLLDTFEYSDHSLMAAGRIVQKSVDKMLIDGDAYPIVGLLADTEFDRYEPREWDNGRDAATKEVIAPLIRSTILNAFEGMNEALKRMYGNADQVTPEADLIDQLKGCAIPYFTKPDYCKRLELKTMWCNNLDGQPRLLKDGSPSIKSIPKNLAGLGQGSWVRQVAGYYALNGQQLPVIVVATANSYAIFNHENCEQLTPDYLNYVIRQTINHCQVTERHLQIATTPMELCGLAETPDWDRLFWHEKPEFKAIAMDLFDNLEDLEKWNLI